MITPKSEKLEKLKNNYKLALEKEKKAIEKQLVNFSKSIIETSIKNENFLNELSKFFDKSDNKKIHEQYLKILELYK